MTDIYSSTSDPIQDQYDGTGSDFDSYHLKSPKSESDSASFEADSLESHGQSSIPISRPLSRSSVTSGLSVTATKDGVEGKRIKRTGIPGYPLNLINKMYSNYAKQQQNQQLQVDNNKENQDDQDDFMSVQSIKSATSLIPQYDPSERDGDRGSMLSSEYYEEQDMEVPRNFELNYNGQIQDEKPIEAGLPDITIENER